MLEPCFQECTCTCGEQEPDFDRIIAVETNFVLSLSELCRKNIGWYGDRTIDQNGVGDWELGKRSGLYFLWHKDDYCDRHDRFHLRALYVGKGGFRQRIKSHWERKDTSEQLLVYFSYVDLPNRAAKYVEQLLLDLYHFPLNKAENHGTGSLCLHLTQSEVD